MIKKTVKYVDFNGVERTEDLYFHLNKAELIEMESNEEEGLVVKLEGIVEAKDSKEIMNYFKKILIESYGVKSPDGKYFVKSKEEVDKFRYSPAYEVLFMELATSSEKSIEFVNGIMPKGLINDKELQKIRSNIEN